VAGKRNNEKPGSQVDAILDAAEAVVLRDGMGRLTLEAVAKRARLSKAGLLHHVASKGALIGAMVKRQVTQWQEEFQRTYQAQVAGGARCPAASSMMNTCMAGTERWTESERARNRVLVAALVHDERQVEPMRKVHLQMEQLLRRDGLKPGVGDTIHLAIHGLWFQWIFGMGDVSAARLRAIRGVLRSLGELEPAGVREVRGAKVAAKTPAKARAGVGRAKRARGVKASSKAAGGATEAKVVAARSVGLRNSESRGGR